MPIVIKTPAHRSEIEDFADFVRLVDEVQTGEPYFDPPETLAAAEWLPGACEQSVHIILARDGGRIVGYCMAQPFESYGRFQSSAADFGVVSSSCLYLSEMGVARSGRGNGIGRALLGELKDRLDPRFDTILVRTLQSTYGTPHPNPAVAFYRKTGFDLVTTKSGPLVEDGAALRHRPRVFLRWSRKCTPEP